MFLGANGLKKAYISAILTLAFISFWNWKSWTSSKSIVIELKPDEQKRSLASIDENNQQINKQRKVAKIRIDCTKDQNIKVNESYLRLELKNCVSKPRLKNQNNHFEASFWKHNDLWVSDYIPLESKSDSLVLITSHGKNKNKRIINISATLYDAI